MRSVICIMLIPKPGQDFILESSAYSEILISIILIVLEYQNVYGNILSGTKAKTRAMEAMASVKSMPAKFS